MFSSLFKYGVIERDGDISRHIFDFLQGFNNEPLSTQYFKKFNGTAVPIEYHFSMEKHIAIIEKLIRNKAKNECVNILLYGAPGTGKTEFAKFAAQELGLPLIAKKASDLLSMYVGMTELLIREAFKEAERERGILFIDEADGLISERGNAHMNWEVTQVNEFLADMEEFRGILICATNFKKNMDSASIRRFNLKVEFDYLDNNGKLVFYKKILEPISNKPLSEEEKTELERIENLAPGDFKVARQKNLFVPKEEISNALLLEALRDEVSAKNIKTNKIGF